jgi:hypothetical protein
MFGLQVKHCRLTFVDGQKERIGRSADLFFVPAFQNRVYPHKRPIIIQVVMPEEAEKISFPDITDFPDIVQAYIPDGFPGMEKPQKALAIDFGHPFVGDHKKSFFLEPKNPGKNP